MSLADLGLGQSVLERPSDQSLSKKLQPLGLHYLNAIAQIL